jgi:hypothetical protein
MSERPTRALLAYCALAERLSTAGTSPISALVPFLEPICAQREGELFDAQVFATDVAARYGLHLPRLAALALTDALAGEGFLVEVVPGARQPAYKYAKNTSKSDKPIDPVTEAQIEALLRQFTAFCRQDDRLQAMGNPDLEEALLARLINADSMRILSRKEGGSDLRRTTKTLSRSDLPSSIDSAARTELHLDFTVSEFLLQLAQNDATTFDIASNVAFASMAAEAIACFQDPGATGDLSSLTVVLDSPLLLDMLGVNSDYEDYGKELLALVKATGASVVTFDHSINEAESAIHAQLEYLRSGVNRAGNAISTTTKPDLLSALYQNVAARCETRLGIQVIRDPQTNLHKRHVAAVGSVQSMLDDRMGAWSHQEAKDYDQKTIWHFLGLRDSGNLIERVCDSKWLFVSRNTALVRIANDAWRTWLKESNRHSLAKIPSAAPIAMSDKQFAGYAWLRKGGTDGSIPRKRLLAHCSAAVRPRADIKARAYNLFLEVHGKEQADDLIVLLSDREGARALMHATRGDPLDVTPERLPQIVEQVKLAAGEYAAKRAREEAQAKISELSEKHDRELTDWQSKAARAQAALESEKSDAEFKIAQAIENESATRAQLATLKRNVWSLERKELEQQLRMLREGLRRGTREYKAARWLVVVLLTLVSAVWGLIATESRMLSIFIPTLIFALSFWFVPNYFEWFARACGCRAINRYLALLGTNVIAKAEDVDFPAVTWTGVTDAARELNEHLSHMSAMPENDSSVTASAVPRAESSSF